MATGTYSNPEGDDRPGIIPTQREFPSEMQRQAREAISVGKHRTADAVFAVKLNPERPLIIVGELAMPRILPVAIALASSAIALSLPAIATAQATPLKPGLYRWGSNYIQLAQRGDRWCFQGFTARATTIASLSRDAKVPHRYQVQGMGAIVQQDRPDQLAYGAADNLLPYTAEPSADTTLTPKMVQCLQSRRPYFQRMHSSR